MKKKELSLENLKLKSFITSYESDNLSTIKGGWAWTAVPCPTDATCNSDQTCPTAPIDCPVPTWDCASQVGC